MKKKIVAAMLTGALVVGSLAGCSKSSSTEETTIYGQVASVDEDKGTITIELAEEPEMKQGEKPDGSAQPSGQPDANSSDSSSTSDSNSSSDSSSSSDSKSSSDSSSTDSSSSSSSTDDKSKGGAPGQNLTLTGEKKTITVSDDTTYTTGMGGGGNGGGEKPDGTPPADASAAPDTNASTDTNTSADASATPDASASTDTSATPDSSSTPGGEKPQDQEASFSDISEGSIVTVTMKGDTVESIQIQGGMGGKDGQTSSTGSTELTAAYTVDGKTEESNSKNYSTTTANESAVLVQNSGNLTLTNATLQKSGDTSSDDESNFYGLNAVVATTKGSTTSVSDTTIESSSDGSNAIFATGEGAKITVDNTTIKTTGNSSRGLDATYGGTVVATNTDITTSGAHCAPLATDRGEGTVSLTKGTLNSSGEGSPCIYSTGDITATNVTGTATGSQAAVVEGKNSITLNKCNLTGAGDNGIMLYQSTSGDAAEGTSTFTATDSTISSSSKGAMFYVTNTDAEATLTNTTLDYTSGTLIEAAGNNTNNWGQEGSNGGNFTLTGVKQTLKGDITCDKISTVALSLTQSSTYEGTINGENAGKTVSVALDSSSKWNVTGDSYLTVLTNDDTDCSNIVSNGHTIYYDKSNESNSWLNGKTITLSDGGKITPAK